MRYAGLDELELYSANPAIVHVRGCHAMGACLRVCHGYIAYAVDREAVVEASVIAQNTAVAVGCVLAETDVGDNEERGEAGAKKTDGLYDRALGIVGCGAEGVFDVWGDGNTKEDYGTETLPYERFEMGDELIEAAAMLVGKGGNEGLLFSLVGYEDGVDEH